MNDQILFVDDDPNLLEAYERKLQHVLHIRTARGPHLGLRELREEGPFAVVVADMNMPLMNGIEFLKKVRELAPDTVRMMLTGNADIKTAMAAVNEGNVFRFLTKPCPSKVMGDSLVAAIQQYRLITAEKEILEGTLNGTAELLTEILSWTSPDTFGRAVQLRNTVQTITAKLGTENSWEIELAATLCQIGMLAIPTETLAKMTEGAILNDKERMAMESVPAVGHELLGRIPRLEDVAKIVLYQNKFFNGEGFPDDQVARNGIPLGSRILKVAADYHTLRSSGLSRQESLKTLQSRDGWYDPAVLSVFGMGALLVDDPADTDRILALPLKELKHGAALASPIRTADGHILVVAGAIITDALLVRLHKYAATTGVTEPIEVFIDRPPLV